MFALYATDLSFDYVPVGLRVSAIYPCRRDMMLIRRERETPNFLVNIGNRLSVISRLRSHLDFHGDVLNENIEIARSKVQTLIALDNAGVDAPAVYTVGDDVASFGNEPFLGRADYQKDSEGIVYYPNYTAYVEAGSPRHDFFVPFLRRRREFRVHILGSQIVGYQLRYYEDESTHASGFAAGCRLRRHESLRQYLRADEQRLAIEMAVEAVRAVDLDFGAVDMMLDQDRVLYVLEVNTSPALDMPRIREDWIRAFNDALFIRPDHYFA